MNIQTLAATRLINGDLCVFGRPAADRSCFMGGVNRVGKQYCFIVWKRLSQILVGLDKASLARFVEFA